MKLYIKNMVCVRCKMLVKRQLSKLGLHYLSVNLGEVEIREAITPVQHKIFKASLHKVGLELMEDKKSILVEKIKKLIIELTQYKNEPLKTNVSSFLSEKLNHDYTYLANLFSKMEGTTIEHYMITLKIERVKELLVYNEISLKEISYQLHYSSVAYLSYQFKKITGLTPSHFKNLKDHPRQGLEEA